MFCRGKLQLRNGGIPFSFPPKCLAGACQLIRYLPLTDFYFIFTFYSGIPDTKILIWNRPWICHCRYSSLFRGYSVKTIGTKWLGGSAVFFNSVFQAGSDWPGKTLSAWWSKNEKWSILYQISGCWGWWHCNRATAGLRCKCSPSLALVWLRPALAISEKARYFQLKFVSFLCFLPELECIELCMYYAIFLY